MHYNELVSQIEETENSQKTKEQRLKELREYIKFHNHLYDDHGSMVIGSRDRPPQFTKRD